MSCFYESLRIEPPAAASFFQSFTQDVELTINGNKTVRVKKDTPYVLLFEAMHHDPSQWREPSRF